MKRYFRLCANTFQECFNKNLRKSSFEPWYFLSGSRKFYLNLKIVLFFRKFAIVETEKLLELANHKCSKANCSGIITASVDPKFHQTGGTCIKLRLICSTCETESLWYSQNNIGSTQYRSGNVALSCGIMFTGVSPRKVLQVLTHADIKGMTVKTFERLQSAYLIPVIDEKYEADSARNIVLRVADERKLYISGDGRFDSPGKNKLWLLNVWGKSFLGFFLQFQCEISSKVQVWNFYQVVENTFMQAEGWMSQTV